MNEAERKRRVLRSKAFSDWWEVRQDEEPTPSNPYQAYMIDLSLHAIVDRRDVWEKLPNRRDLPEIDLPYSGVPTYAPARKPPRRREAPYKSPELPKTGIERDIILSSEAMATSHGKPAPRVIALSRSGPLTSEAAVGLGRIMGIGPLIRANQGEIRIGTKGSRATVLAAQAHETGHVIHAQDLFTTGSKLEGLKPFKGTPSSFSDELSATKLARGHLKKTLSPKGEYPTATWFLKYGLHTYRKGWEKRGKPVKVDRSGNILSGGEY